MDLSQPNGGSVNDGISPSMCSLRYSSVDEAVDIRSHDTQLVKLDIKDAYRLIPVHPDDYHLLGISWRGETYIDALPFGHRSTPQIFSAVADLVAWVLHQHGIKHQLHYLDDFLFREAPNSKETAQILPLVLEIFRVLGIPIATHKTEGPASILVFLGILIDTNRFELHLPAEKIAHLQSVLRQWTQKKSCTRRDLESLLGHLSHTATVVKQGHCCPWTGHPITSFASMQVHEPTCDGGVHSCKIGMVPPFSQFPPPPQVTSDASEYFGCGVFSLSHGWFQLEWPESWHAINIAAKELVPIVIAAALWVQQWRHTCVF